MRNGPDPRHEDRGRFHTVNRVMAEGIRRKLDKCLGDFQGNAVAGVGDVVITVWLWFAVFTDVHEHNLLDGQDGFLREDVAHLSTQGDRGATEVDSSQAHLDEVALLGGSDEVDLGHEFGDHVLVAKLDDRVDCRLFVDPTQQASAEQRAVCIEVFGANPFARMKSNTFSHTENARSERELTL